VFQSTALHISPFKFDDSWEHLPRAATQRLRAPWHSGSVTSLALTRDASLACSSGTDGRIRVWNLRSGELQWEFEQSAQKVLLSPDARTLWSIDENFHVVAFDLVQGDVIGNVWHPPRQILRGTRPDAAVISPDGRWLLATCGDLHGAVRIIDLTTGSTLSLSAPGAGELHPIGNFSADANSVQILGGVREGRVGRSRSAMYSFRLATGEVQSAHVLRFSATGPSATVAVHRQQCSFGVRWLMVSDRKRTIARWSIEGTDPVTWIELPVDSFESLTSGEHVYGGTFSRGNAVLWSAHDASEGPSVHILPDRERASSLCFSADNLTMLVGTTVGHVGYLSLIR
jgi:WD40 repeat protein